MIGITVDEFIKTFKQAFGSNHGYMLDTIILHPEAARDIYGAYFIQLKNDIEYEVSSKEFFIIKDLGIRTDSMSVEEFEKLLLVVRI